MFVLIVFKNEYPFGIEKIIGPFENKDTARTHAGQNVEWLIREVSVLPRQPRKTESKYPVFCPMCGHEELQYNLAEWFAHSLETCDLHNTAELTETQCAKCGVAFWT